MISGDSYIEGRASAADRIYLSPAEQELFYRSQLAVEDSFAQGRVAEFFAGVDVRAMVEQIANDFEAALARSEIQRHTTVAPRIDVGSRKMKQLQTVEIPIHRGLREISLPLLLVSRPAVHNRQRENERAGKCDGASNN